MTDVAVHQIVGRAGELSVITAFLDESAGGPASLLLQGDAVVGKTTLWKEGLEAARERSYRVLMCQPVESEA